MAMHFAYVSRECFTGSGTECPSLERRSFRMFDGRWRSLTDYVTRTDRTGRYITLVWPSAMPVSSATVGCYQWFAVCSAPFRSNVSFYRSDATLLLFHSVMLIDFGFLAWNILHRNPFCLKLMSQKQSWRADSNLGMQRCYPRRLLYYPAWVRYKLWVPYRGYVSLLSRMAVGLAVAESGPWSPLVVFLYFYHFHVKLAQIKSNFHVIF